MGVRNCITYEQVKYKLSELKLEFDLNTIKLVFYLF